MATLPLAAARVGSEIIRKEAPKVGQAVTQGLTRRASTGNLQEAINGFEPGRVASMVQKFESRTGGASLAKTGSAGHAAPSVATKASDAATAAGRPALPPRSSSAVTKPRANSLQNQFMQQRLSKTELASNALDAANAASSSTPAKQKEPVTGSAAVDKVSDTPLDSHAAKSKAGAVARAEAAAREHLDARYARQPKTPADSPASEHSQERPSLLSSASSESLASDLSSPAVPSLASSATSVSDDSDDDVSTTSSEHKPKPPKLESAAPASEVNEPVQNVPPPEHDWSHQAYNRAMDQTKEALNTIQRNIDATPQHPALQKMLNVSYGNIRNAYMQEQHTKYSAILEGVEIDVVNENAKRETPMTKEEENAFREGQLRAGLKAYDEAKAKGTAAALHIGSGHAPGSAEAYEQQAIDNKAREDEQQAINSKVREDQMMQEQLDNMMAKDEGKKEFAKTSQWINDQEKLRTNALQSAGAAGGGGEA